VNIRIFQVILVCFVTILFSGCATLLNAFHRGNDGFDNPASENAGHERGAPRKVRSNEVDLQDASSSKYPDLEPQTKHLYRNGQRVTRDDFIDQSQEEGSLWASTGQTNYYFTKNKIRSPGDLVSLNIENELFREIGHEIKKSLTPREKDKEIELYQEGIRNRVSKESDQKPKETSAPPAATATAQTGTAAPAVAEDNSKNPMKSNISDIDIGTSLEFKTGDSMMGEIIERYPNGNYKIRTRKRIPYKNGIPRMITVVGIIRPSDINDDTDIINSGKLYDYRVDVAN
jgi:flagellar basal body L-ring protein FlgH